MAADAGDEELGVALLFADDSWRQRAAQRLVELLTVAELRRLCGDFEKSLRAMRRAQEGRDRPSTKWELAEILVIQHDADLLAQPDLRRLLAKALTRAGHDSSQIAPMRWHPGKDAAVNFTRALGFPPNLAGEPAAERPPAFLTIDPPPQHQRLADFQLEVSDQLLGVLNADSGMDRALVTLPTGAGKTRVAVQTLHRWTHDVTESNLGRSLTVVWLAHTEELCEQACACITEVWQSSPDGTQPLLLLRWWGEFSARVQASRESVSQSRGRVRFLVGTPQSYRHKLQSNPDLSSSLLGGLRCIVIDEAHRAAAPSYVEIIDGHQGDKVSVIGLTATPYAKEYDQHDPTAGTLALREVFEGRLIEAAVTLGKKPRETLQQREILARPLFRNIETRVRLKGPDLPTTELSLEAIDQFDRAYAESADQHQRRRLVVKEIAEVYAADPAARMIYFGPTVHDAEQTAFLLRREKIAAAAVSGTTLEATRRRLIAEFRAGDLQVLCNCEVLTTGFDAPKTTHVVVARPTVSQVLYEQMVGRGLRGPKFGGTSQCVILDCKDEFRRPAPRLGYQAFREVWAPEQWLGDTTTHIGLRLHSPGGRTLDVERGADGQTRKEVTLKSRAEAGFILRRTGSGIAHVRFTMRHENEQHRLAELELGDEQPEFRCQQKEYTAGTRFVFSVRTSDPQTFVEVIPFRTRAENQSGS